MSLAEIERDHDSLAGVRDRIDAARALVDRSLIALDAAELAEATLELGIARAVLMRLRQNAEARGPRTTMNFYGKS